MLKILAIETSCDETAAAIISLDGASPIVLSSMVSSQAELHAAWGGVIPNLAAREHVRNIIPVVESALHEAGISPHELDGLAVTQGPGLIPALLVGVSAAKTLSIAWDKPLLGVNHLEGHIYANLFTEGAELRFPLLALIVSGGHTQLVLMQGHFEYQLLGETDDDAAGEAFDKVAKMLGLPYPGGPEIGKRADSYRTSTERGPTKKFPRPLLDADNYRFSFSGLKTAVLYSLKKEPDERLLDPDFVAETAHEFQEAVVDTLVGKTERAIQEFQPKTLVIAGGVSANARLRERMEAMAANYSDCQFLMPPFKYSLDNAAMIGSAAVLRYARLSETERTELKTNAALLEPSAHFPLTK
ncbi:MAG: tRNA (adenosine(37)-N6)-threonylcarbamoyltransferase complex transferase subunit TsaD [Undibacterium sp.]